PRDLRWIDLNLNPWRLYKMEIIPRFEIPFSCRHSYIAPVALVVTDPFSVAKAYHQEQDPAHQAIHLMKSLFENRASHYNHDQIIHWDPPFEEYNISWLRDIGIKIQPNGKPMFREDRYYSELARIRQESKEME